VVPGKFHFGDRPYTLSGSSNPQALAGSQQFGAAKKTLHKVGRYDTIGGSGVTDTGLTENAAQIAPEVTKWQLPPGILLHVGCGPIAPEGWTNLDASWSVVISRVPGLRKLLRTVGLISNEAASQNWPRNVRFHNVAHGLPFENGTVTAVYASHVLEHLTHSQARYFLEESFRVIAPGGVIRVVVPNLEALATRYLSRKSSGAPDRLPADKFMAALRTCPDYSSLPLLLRLYRAYNDTLSHKWMYDAESLQSLLRDVWFRDAMQKGYLESLIPNIADVETASRFEDGVCVEAIR